MRRWQVDWMYMIRKAFVAIAWVVCVWSLVAMAAERWHGR